MNRHTAVVDVKGALVDALRARWPEGEDGSPAVLYGFEDDLPDEVIVIAGTPDAQRTYRAVNGGELQSSEVFGLEAVISVIVTGDGGQQRAANERAAELLDGLVDVIEAAITNPPAAGPLGVPAIQLLEISSLQLEEETTTTTSEALVSFAIRVTASLGGPYE